MALFPYIIIYVSAELAPPDFYFHPCGTKNILRTCQPPERLWKSFLGRLLVLFCQFPVLILKEECPSNSYQQYRTCDNQCIHFLLTISISHLPNSVFIGKDNLIVRHYQTFLAISHIFLLFALSYAFQFKYITELTLQN